MAPPRATWCWATGRSPTPTCRRPRSPLRPTASRSSPTSPRCAPRSPTAWATSASEVVRVLRDVPLGDMAVVALELEALDREEGADQLAAQRLAQGGVGLERVERLAERERDRIALVLLGQLVDQAGHGGGRRQLPLDAVQPGEEQRGGRQV